MKKILIPFLCAAACAGVLFLGCAKETQAASSSDEAVEIKTEAESFAVQEMPLIIITSDEPEGTAETETSGAEAVLEEETETKPKTEPEKETEQFSKAETVITDKDREVYSYALMEAVLKNMVAGHPDLLALESLAVTADGRNVYCLRAGSEDAPHKVLLTASIHAREYITTELLMKLISDFLDHLESDSRYGEVSYRYLLKECAVYFVPMVNPDGVTISQFGPDGLKNGDVRENVMKIAEREGGGSSAYYRHWKSSAEGVDLNRQFDAKWDEYNDHVGQPSADHYKGTAPGTTPEAAALIDLTEREKFDRTISYHTAGGVIYWYFGQTGELYDETERFANRLSRVTRYPLDANYEALDPAGYKDWAICKKGIPSLTIEVGQGDSPLAREQLGGIYQKNSCVIEETILSATGD